MSQYLTKGQVLADFKVNIYPPLKKMIGDDFEQIKEFWDLNLEGHLTDKNITESQRKKWRITKEDLI